jgi:hypothetical protein
MPRPLPLRGKSRRYLLQSLLVGSQCRSKLSGEVKGLLLIPRMEPYFSGSLIIIFFLWCNSPNQAKVSRSHKFDTHPVWLLWISDQLNTDATAYTTHNKKETNIHAFSAVRTNDPKNQEAEDLHVRPHGHRNRFQVITLTEISRLHKKPLKITIHKYRACRKYKKSYTSKQ